MLFNDKANLVAVKSLCIELGQEINLSKSAAIIAMQSCGNKSSCALNWDKKLSGN